MQAIHTKVCGKSIHNTAISRDFVERSDVLR